MIMYKYALLRALRHRVTLIFSVILPLILIFIQPFWADGMIMGFSFTAIFMMLGCFMMSHVLLEDKTSGAIQRILSTPTGMFRYMMENLLAAMTPMFTITLVVTTAGMILYGWTITFTLSLALAFIVYNLCMISLCFAWYCLFKSQESSQSSFAFVMTFMALIGGLFVPVSMFPGILQYLGAVFPTYWVAQAMVSLLETGWELVNYWFSIGILILLTIAFLLFGGKRRII